MSSIDIRELEKKRQGKVASSPSTNWTNGLNKLLDKEISLFPAKFTDKNKEAFYLELSTLLAAGLNLKSSLELLEAEQTASKHKKLMADITHGLVQGMSLWEALQRTGFFTPYEYYSVQIGEETGKLSVVLDQLYRFYQSRLKQKRQLISALSYPVIILFTSIGAVAFMLLFIVPMFNDVFKRFGGDLPALTKLIIGFSGAVQSNFIFVSILLMIGGVLIYLNREKEWLARIVTRVVSKIPVIGKIIVALQMARFCNSMALLLSSKVPLIKALQLIGQMISFFPIRDTLDKIADDVMHGVSLNASMSKFPVYSRKMVSLVKVGEEVNKLDLFFEKLSAQYSTEAEHQTGLLNTFLEPTMIIFLGIVVGFILLAMYLPMFQMSTNIGI